MSSVNTPVEATPVATEADTALDAAFDTAAGVNEEPSEVLSDESTEQVDTQGPTEEEKTVEKAQQKILAKVARKERRLQEREAVVKSAEQVMQARETAKTDPWSWIEASGMPAEDFVKLMLANDGEKSQASSEVTEVKKEIQEMKHQSIRQQHKAELVDHWGKNWKSYPTLTQLARNGHSVANDVWEVHREAAKQGQLLSHEAAFAEVEKYHARQRKIYGVTGSQEAQNTPKKTQRTPDRTIPNRGAPTSSKSIHAMTEKEREADFSSFMDSLNRDFRKGL